MNTQFSNPREWLKNHPRESMSREEAVLMDQWLNVSIELMEASEYVDTNVLPWIKNQQQDAPDVLRLFASYGRTRIVVGDWKETPIAVPEEHQKVWQKELGLLTPLSEIYAWQAGIAAGVAEAMFVNTALFCETVTRQVDACIGEIEHLSATPIEAFRPTDWSDLPYEHDYEAEADAQDSLERIFDLVEKLLCFEHGLEEIRMLMITQTNPKFHVPNVGFYNALCAIDSHAILMAIAHAEPKMRQVLKLWSETIMPGTGKPYHRPYDDSAPEQFWWRHRQKRGRSKANRPGKSDRSSSEPRSNHKQRIDRPHRTPNTER